MLLHRRRANMASVTLLDKGKLPERRSHCRYSVVVEIQYQVIGTAPPPKVGRGRIVDLSSGGLLFEADTALPEGAALNLYIPWPACVGNHFALWCTGRILRCEGLRTAVALEHAEFRAEVRSQPEESISNCQK